MLCPTCQSETRVIDSRATAESTRRRRQCSACGNRFTTFERIERRMPEVVKKSGQREPYSRDKVLHGILLACRKRPLDPAILEGIADQVEVRLEGRATASTAEVGEAVMNALREVDAVAYLRFASVYQRFDSVEQFVEIIRPMREQG